MPVKSDLLSQQTLSLDVDGYTTERTFLVEGVGGTPESRLYNAMTTSGVPQINDPHPILPDVRVTKLNASANSSGSQISVTVIYSIPKADETATDATSTGAISSGSVTLSTTLANDQTWFDIDGNFIKVSYLSGFGIATQYKEADVQRPRQTVTFKRTESVIPKSVIANYLGKINSVPWSGFPAKTWLCSRVDATQDQEGKFEVSYGFSYDPNTWRLEVIANLTDDDISAAIPDKDTQNAYATFDVYDSIDFNALGLSF